MTRLKELNPNLFVVKCLSRTVNLIDTHACEELHEQLTSFMMAYVIFSQTVVREGSDYSRHLMFLFINLSCKCMIVHEFVGKL
jgi:hypothetical protein